MIDEANKHTSDRSGMVVSRDGGQSTDARVVPTLKTYGRGVLTPETNRATPQPWTFLPPIFPLPPILPPTWKAARCLSRIRHRPDDLEPLVG
jgi:hypothetical protein